MSLTIINTQRRIYFFDPDLNLFDITDLSDIYFDNIVDEPVNEGQFRNLYIVTNNWRHPKRWDGIAPEVSDLGGLIDIRVFRAATMEINNDHVIFGNVSKYGSGTEGGIGLGVINDVTTPINEVLTPINAFGTTREQGAKRFNKTVIWSDIGRPEYYIPEQNNQAGDIDFDEDGYAIVRIKRLAEFNIVYKEKSIWLMIHVGLPFVYVKKFYNDDIGLLANRAIFSINNIHYFVGNDYSIYRFDGVNLANLTTNHHIADYIKANVQFDMVHRTEAFADVDRKEVEFHFVGKQKVDKQYNKFAIVYNYEDNMFSIRDSIAECGGYYSPKPRQESINNYLPSRPMNKIYDAINKVGIFGVPARKLLIGDEVGQLHHYNHGDWFGTNEDSPAMLETGDEDYAEPSGGRLANTNKLISDIKFLLENAGVNEDLVVSIGTRSGMDGTIRWSKPYRYRQDGDGNGHVYPRDNGVYHRIKLEKVRGHIRILGYIPRIEPYGESRR